MHDDVTTDELIGTTAAARLLGRSPRTVQRMVVEGELKPVLTAPVGRHGSYLFARRDVERLRPQEAAP